MTGPAFGRDLPAEWFIGDTDQRALHAELEGQPMPALNLEDWRNGELTTEAMEGKIVLIDFWATWCAPCIAAIPTKNAIHETYADQGVVVLGVCGSSFGQDRHDQILERFDVKYPSARDASLENADRFRVTWWPTYVIVDRHGIVRGVGLAGEHLEDAVKLLLEEQPAADQVAAADEAS
ncbi:MAG: TlpA disulfide reductase family protein [Planctomycetota bacterium]